MKMNSITLILSLAMQSAFVFEAAGQEPAQMQEFTPEQQVVMRRLIDEGVARAMLDAEKKAASRLDADGGLKAKVALKTDAAAMRCVLGFAMENCKHQDDGATLQVAKGSARALMAQGVSPSSPASVQGETELLSLAPMGLGPVEYDPALSFVPAGRSAAGLPRRREGFGAQGEIAFSEDGSVASIRFGREKAGLHLLPGGYTAFVDGWSLQVSSSVDEPDLKRANFATLDGFSSGLSMSLEYTRQRSKLQAKDPEVLRRDLGALCTAVGLVVDCTYEDALFAVKSSADKEQEMRSKAMVTFQRKQFRWLRDYAFRVTAARERFDYLTPQLQTTDEHRVGWGVGATAAFVSPSRRWMYLLGADYQKRNDSADVAILCPSSVGFGPVTCVEGASGPPSGATRKLLSAEVRSNFSVIGYSLKVAHDFESDTTGVDLPIYLLRNVDGALTGGVRLGWSSRQDVVFGIFLSSPLEL